MLGRVYPVACPADVYGDVSRVVRSPDLNARTREGIERLLLWVPEIVALADTDDRVFG